MLMTQHSSISNMETQTHHLHFLRLLRSNHLSWCLRTEHLDLLSVWFHSCRQKNHPEGHQPPHTLFLFQLLLQHNEGQNQLTEKQL